ncbi:MAG: C39 family peptidase [Coriobacteriales bacterium]
MDYRRSYGQSSVHNTRRRSAIEDRREFHEASAVRTAGDIRSASRGNSWRSGIYTQQARRGSFLFSSSRRMRRSPLASVAVFALCAALVLVAVLSGKAALQDTLRLQAGDRSAGAGSIVASAQLGEDAPSSTPKREWRAGTTPCLYQKDPKWSEQRYAGDTVGISGCGPTCLSMVYVCLTGKTGMDPGRMAEFSQNGGYVEDGKTAWRLMSEGAAQLGLNSWEVPYDESQICSLLQAGTPIICSMMPGDFTDTGHFIVLCGIDEQGRVLLRDPNSPERSGTSWDLSRIMPQIANLWAFSR